MRRLVMGLVIAVVAFSAAGCIGVSGDTCRPDMPTLGRELEDLEAAREAGAIDEREYERFKEKLLAEPRCPRADCD